jgi:hypothetical protein
MKNTKLYAQLASAIGVSTVGLVSHSLYYLAYITEPMERSVAFLAMGSLGYAWTFFGYGCYMNVFVKKHGHSIKNAIFYTAIYGAYYYWKNLPSSKSQ